MGKFQTIETNYRGAYDGDTLYHLFDEVADPSGNRYVLKVPEIRGRSYLYPAYWAKVADVADAADTAALDEAIDALNTAVLEKTGYGIFAGLAVTAQATPDMTVAIASGVAYRADGTRQAPAAVVSQAVTAADATNGRKDLVYLSSAGVVTYLAGTPDASPAVPATPADGFALAEIAVAANTTTVATENITDKRKRYFYVA